MVPAEDRLQHEIQYGKVRWPSRRSTNGLGRLSEYTVPSLLEVTAYQTVTRSSLVGGPRSAN